MIMKKIIPLLIFYPTINAIFTYKICEYHIKKSKNN